MISRDVWILVSTILLLIVLFTLLGMIMQYFVPDTLDLTCVVNKSF